MAGQPACDNLESIQKRMPIKQKLYGVESVVRLQLGRLLPLSACCVCISAILCCCVGYTCVAKDAFCQHEGRSKNRVVACILLTQLSHH